METVTEHTLESLRVLAELQYAKVKQMSLTDALKCLPDNDHYSELRMIYERPGEFGTYLFPKNKDRDRRALYDEYSHKADQLFRTKLEEYFGVIPLTQEIKNNIFADAWSRGHAHGYNEVFHYYDECVEQYDRHVRGEITYAEFENYLDI